jgi:hypothetical protein
VDPYLALFARAPQVAKTGLDGALAEQRLWIVPGVRGCIWLVNEQDVSLALRVSEAQARRRLDRDMEKLSVPQAELAEIGERAVAALADKALLMEELRAALPEGSVRSLGEAGKKLGHTTTLPAALRYLEWAGKLRRHPHGGGLDTNRYAWGLADKDTRTLGDAPSDAVGQAQELLARFLAWAGPATLSDFVAWSGLGKRVAQSALGASDPVAVEIEGLDETAYVLAEHASELDSVDGDDGTYFLPGLDNLFSLRSNPAPLADPAHHELELMAMGKRTVTLAKAAWIEPRPIVHRGEWVGLWAWDPERAEVLMAPLGTWSKVHWGAARAAADGLSEFIAGSLDGRAPTNSIDSDKRARERVEFLGRLAG